MKTILSLAVLSLFGALAGCSSDSTKEPAKVESVHSTLARNTSPTLTDAESDTLAKGEARFAVDMLKTVSATQGDENVFLSPHSISIALGMTYAGARGETAAEMKKKALHLDLPADRVRAGFDYLDLQLASRGKNAEGSDGQPFRLNIANAIWGQKGGSFVPAFLVGHIVEPR